MRGKAGDNGIKCKNKIILYTEKLSSMRSPRTGGAKFG